MRHRKKRHHLSRPADQRKALLRTLATSFIKHGEIITTHKRAKATQELVEHLIHLTKRNDVHAIRQAARWIYNHPLVGETHTTEAGKTVPLTVLRKLFAEVAEVAKNRPNGGYTRVLKIPPRRGDAAPMALLQLVQ